MSERIGIITSDPAISAAIYREILRHTEAKEQTDFVLYSRDLSDVSENVEIIEGTDSIKPMDVDAVAFPEIEQDVILESDRQKIPLIHNELLPSIPSEKIEKIRDHLLNDTVPDDKADRALYAEVMFDVSLWADALVQFAEKGIDNDHDTKLIDGINKDVQDYSNIIIESAIKHKDGFIGLQGGMGPEAGLDAFSYIGDNSNASIVLDSSATMPNEAEYILELLESGLHNAMKTVDPTDRLVETRERLEAMNPDCISMQCNTAHFFEEKIEEKANKIDFVHIIEEGLKSIEKKENGETTKLLLFATTASVNSKIFDDALERIGRDDIEIVTLSNNKASKKPTEILVPDSSEQDQINSAIWNDILENKSPEEAGKKFQLILDSHPDADGVIMGCTEIKFGMEHVTDSPDIIIDNAKAAADKSIEIAEEKGRERGEVIEKIEKVESKSDLSIKGSVPYTDLAKSKSSSIGR